MANVRITNAAQQATMDAFTALINTGGAGTIAFYTGTQPADADDAIGSVTLLGTLTFSADAFGDAAVTGTATAGAITGDSSADASGVAAWARIRNGAGTTIFDCDAGEAADSATITLDNKNIVAGGTINITSFTLTMPSGV